MYIAEVILGILIMVWGSPGSDSEITPGEFARLHQEIRPRPGEARWADIPWL